MSSKMLN